MVKRRCINHLLGKAGALSASVTQAPDSQDSSLSATPACVVLETPEFSMLRHRIGDALSFRAFDIAARWKQRARSVALRDESGEGTTADGLTAVSLVEATAQALRSEVSPIRLGRRLQRKSSLLTIATTRGYTQATADGMRD